MKLETIIPSGSFGVPLVLLWSPFAKPMIYGFMVSLPNQPAEPNYLMAEGRLMR